MWLPTSASALIKLFERFDRFVGAGDELLALLADSDSSAGLRGTVPSVSGTIVTDRVLVLQCLVSDITVALAIGWALLRHRLSTSVGQRFGLFELCLVRGAC